MTTKSKLVKEICCFGFRKRDVSCYKDHSNFDSHDFLEILVIPFSIGL